MKLIVIPPYKNPAVNMAYVISESLARMQRMNPSAGDSLILGCEPTEFWEDEVRRELDAAGYDEIPLICPMPACVQMAKAMVAMQLKQTPRAYPTDRLRAQPEYA